MGFQLGGGKMAAVGMHFGCSVAERFNFISFSNDVWRNRFLSFLLLSSAYSCSRKSGKYTWEKSKSAKQDSTGKHTNGNARKRIRKGHVWRGRQERSSFLRQREIYDV